MRKSSPSSRLSQLSKSPDRVDAASTFQSGSGVQSEWTQNDADEDFLLGQGCLVVSIVSGGLWASTQWTAAMLGNQPRLGAPLTTVLGQPIYAPWRLFEWWYAYEAYAPDVFLTAGMLAGGSGLAGTVVAIAGSLWRARQSKNVTTYGSARWAKFEDLKRWAAWISRPCYALPTAGRTGRPLIPTNPATQRQLKANLLAGNGRSCLRRGTAGCSTLSIGNLLPALHRLDIDSRTGLPNPTASPQAAHHRPHHDGGRAGAR